MIENGADRLLRAGIAASELKLSITIAHFSSPIWLRGSFNTCPRCIVTVSGDTIAVPIRNQLPHSPRRLVEQLAGESHPFKILPHERPLLCNASTNLDLAKALVLCSHLVLGHVFHPQKKQTTTTNTTRQAQDARGEL
jgi:hypothetical protein